MYRDTAKVIPEYQSPTSQIGKLSCLLEAILPSDIESIDEASEYYKNYLIRIIGERLRTAGLEAPAVRALGSTADLLRIYESEGPKEAAIYVVNAELFGRISAMANASIQMGPYSFAVLAFYPESSALSSVESYMPELFALMQQGYISGMVTISEMLSGINASNRHVISKAIQLFRDFRKLKGIDLTEEELESMSDAELEQTLGYFLYAYLITPRGFKNQEPPQWYKGIANVVLSRIGQFHGKVYGTFSEALQSLVSDTNEKDNLMNRGEL